MSTPRTVCQANVWIAVFGYVGNYFWTHYFFKVLGASYTMKSHRLNNVGYAGALLRAITL